VFADAQKSACRQEDTGARRTAPGSTDAPPLLARLVPKRGRFPTVGPRITMGIRGAFAGPPARPVARFAPPLTLVSP
jgi:hypothetical protein